MARTTPQLLARRVELGERVRALRQASGLSQEDFGHAAGLDRTYVGSVERGERNVSLDNLHRIADALGVPVGELF